VSPTMTETENAIKGLLTRREAAARCYLERLRKGEAVFTNGVFDVLHRGHIEYLAEARKLGDLLIVGLNSDESTRRLKGPSRPVNKELDRAAVLLALKSVDAVVLFEEDTPEELIREVKPTRLLSLADRRCRVCSVHRRQGADDSV
jgi:D-beta-D-heptose 7-phosphate kinase / D-beta-D-heptose 1-phosphate adenosyltransferase